MSGEAHSPDAARDGDGAGRAAHEILRRLQDEHASLCAALAQLAGAVSPRQPADSVALQVGDALRSLRELLPAHLMKEISILFPELEAAGLGASRALADAKQMHAKLDAQFGHLQAKVIPLLLGVEDPRARRAARRAALALQRDCAALNAFGRGDSMGQIVRALPEEAARAVLERFNGADARRALKASGR